MLLVIVITKLFTEKCFEILFENPGKGSQAIKEVGIPMLEPVYFPEPIFG
jgi:hypothetical protein